ncbi:MAG: hypothetical protein COS94_01365 [Candidatus Hydrogenedentes bacterium CG07_land_8_20_14_0_80_42_17]|nr:MAG: hypothetical protein COS94_01365 [Candidatus Hydrogenedentes bacterium CG07_land_8_20_14_0_80_42_17]
MAIKKCPNCGHNVKYPQGVAPWCLSYGDMMTNLMAFFVALLSFATFDANKFEAAVKSMAVTFGVGFMESGETINLSRQRLLNRGDRNEPLGEAQTPIMSTAPELMGWLKDQLGQAVTAEQTEEGFKISITNSVLFDAGSSILKPEAGPLLDRISFFLNGPAAGADFRIEGHTDAVAFFDALGNRDNLTLSTDRAISVYRSFSIRNIEKKRMSVAGYGDQRPVPRFPDETDEDYYSRNRRVEIVVRWSHLKS